MTTTSERRRRTEIHEASHGVISAVLHLPVQLLSVRPTEHYGGLMVPAQRRRAPHDPNVVNLPVLLWPARTRRALERSAFVSLAGPVGSLHLGPRISEFVAPTDDEARAEADARALARLHPATRNAVMWQEAAATEPMPTDDDNAYGNAIALVGNAEAAAWLGWARQSVARLVLEYASEIQAVADELSVETVISGRRMLAVMKAAD